MFFYRLLIVFLEIIIFNFMYYAHVLGNELFVHGVIDAASGYKDNSSIDTDHISYYSDININLLYAIDLNDTLLNIVVQPRYYYNNNDNSEYTEIGNLYIEIRKYTLGYFQIGNTNSAYFNGLASWFDYGFTGGDEVLDTRDKDLLKGTNASGNSLYYSVQIDNIRYALQLMAPLDADMIYYDSPEKRNYGIAESINYAFGPLTFAFSHIYSNIQDDVIGTTYNTNKFGIGSKFQYNNIYTALAITYDVNQFQFNQDTYALNYIFRYKNTLKVKNIFSPQLMYGYRKTANGADKDLIDNYLYLSLSYYFEKNIQVFGDVKLDFLQHKNMLSTEYPMIHENQIMAGFKYTVDVH